VNIQAGDTFLRLAVASDLHAYSIVKDTPAPSHFQVETPESDPGKNPISGLQKLLSEEMIRAEMLLCPGDIGHQAQQIAIQHAWSSLNSLRENLAADHLFATAGNHDLDSRYLSNDYDALEYLKNLTPPFPFPSEEMNDKFWSQHFAIFEGDLFRIVVLNSSAYHGAEGRERDHGRIAPPTIAKIKRSLETVTPKRVNILLCHHHPQQHTEFNLGEYDVMKNGQLLLDLLGSGRLGRWLVVHGHKHHPKISYASGGGGAPVVFSAGSLCASLYPELQSVTRNQFHLITIPINLIPQMGLVGVVKSWDWASGEGWAPAGTKSGLPSVCGFGYRGDPLLLANRIASEVTGDVEEWSEIKSKIPEVDFLIPQDLAALRYLLRDVHGLSITDLDDLPRQIGRSL